MTRELLLQHIGELYVSLRIREAESAMIQQEIKKLREESETLKRSLEGGSEEKTDG